METTTLLLHLHLFPLLSYTGIQNKKKHLLWQNKKTNCEYHDTNKYFNKYTVCFD